MANKLHLERLAGFMPSSFSSYAVRTPTDTVGYLRKHEQKRRGRPQSVNVIYWTATLVRELYPLGAEPVRVAGGKWRRGRPIQFRTRTEALGALMKALK